MKKLLIIILVLFSMNCKLTDTKSLAEPYINHEWTVRSVEMERWNKHLILESGNARVRFEVCTEEQKLLIVDDVITLEYVENLSGSRYDGICSRLKVSKLSKEK